VLPLIDEFSPRRFPILTVLLILVCVAIFAYQQTLPDNGTAGDIDRLPIVDDETLDGMETGAEIENGLARGHLELADGVVSGREIEDVRILRRGRSGFRGIGKEVQRANEMVIHFQSEISRRVEGKQYGFALDRERDGGRGRQQPGGGDGFLISHADLDTTVRIEIGEGGVFKIKTVF